MPRTRHRHRLPRARRLAARILFAAAASSWTARAAPTAKELCIDAADEGQVLRSRGQLVAARTRFLTCAGGECPPVVRQTCDAWRTEVEQSLPTVVVAAHAPDGRDVSDARVWLDGAPIEGALAGRAIPVDPGAHEFVFVAADGRTAQTTAIAREGEKNRLVVARFAEPAPARAALAERRDGGRVFAYASGGVAVLGLASFAFFGLTGKSDLENLRDTCAPNCSRADVDAVHAKFDIADASLVVAAVALAASAYLFLRAPPSPSPARPTIGEGGAAR